MLEAAMERLRQGDRSALQIIYTETKDGVFALCYSYLRRYHLAEDMTEDTYINVLHYILRYKQGTNPKSWIYAIAKNLCLNEIKRRRRETAMPEDAESLIASDYTLRAKDESGVIRLVMQTLKKHESAIVIMHAVGGIPLKDVAKTLGKPYATVRWQYSNALGKLKSEIEKRELL